MAGISSQPVWTLRPSITFNLVSLKTKPKTNLACTQVQSAGKSGFSEVFVVFLNGLVTSQMYWLPVMRNIIEYVTAATTRDGNDASRPQMLAYDRFGQGKTYDRDPGDKGKEHGYGHDILDAVRDLHQLISQTMADSVYHPKKIMFIANSIGCAIARLYAQEYPRTVAGMLFLDSVMANSDFVNIFPDPDSPYFDHGSLPRGVTAEMLRKTREAFRREYHPSVKNKEGLDLRNLATLLPYADKPSLEQGYGGRAPFVTIVGHDPDQFATESLLGPTKTPVVITMNYTNRIWQHYHEGLIKLTDPHKSSGPVIAKDCGHFIQKDDPKSVAQLAWIMLSNIAKES
ncbi:Alpha/Beta hydrolase protein [Xylaria nigripes]|nr:Alpha/Beta hydrolase protein [Xylaria nigripes]